MAALGSAPTAGGPTTSTAAGGSRRRGASDRPSPTADNSAAGRAPAFSHHFAAGPLSRFGAPKRADLMTCRITNDNSEIFKEGENDPTAPDWLMSVPVVDPNTPNPEMGDLMSRVPHDWFDLMTDNFEFKEDRDYWFTEPPGGWKEVSQEKLRVPRPEKNQPIASAEHLGAGRVKLQDLKEGQVLTGEVNTLHWNHGVQVDIGAEFDGLIPVMDKYMWQELKQHGVVQALAKGPLDIGKTVKIRIHKIRDPDIYRWPVQAVIEEPAIVPLMPENFDPDSWRCPKDLRDVQSPEQLKKYFTEEEIAQATKRYYMDKVPVDVFSDPEYDEEEYFFQEEVEDAEGQVYERWQPVPKDKEGKQYIVSEFIRKGINVAPRSLVFPDEFQNPWEVEEDTDDEAHRMVLAEEADGLQEQAKWSHQY